MPDTPPQRHPSGVSAREADDVDTPIGALRELFDERADKHGWDPDGLVTGHLWLVDRLAANAARRYPSHVDRGDLWSAGVLGLVEASRRYDPSTGVPFASFASARVRGEIIDQARSRDMASRRLRQVLRLVVRASDFLAQHLGRTATLEEIAQATGIPLDTVRTALDELASITDVQSLDEPSTATDNALVAREAEPADQLTEAELLGTVRDAVDQLPEPLRTIVMRSYWDGSRLQDIAQDMNITFQRVAQYRNEALVALNAWFSHLYDEIDDPDADAPGKARRAAFCATMAARSTWRSRLEAATVITRADSVPNHLRLVPDHPSSEDDGAGGSGS